MWSLLIFLQIHTKPKLKDKCWCSELNYWSLGNRWDLLLCITIIVIIIKDVLKQSQVVQWPREKEIHNFWSDQLIVSDWIDRWTQLFDILEQTWWFFSLIIYRKFVFLRLFSNFVSLYLHMNAEQGCGQHISYWVWDSVQNLMLVCKLVPKKPTAS